MPQLTIDIDDDVFARLEYFMRQSEDETGMPRTVEGTATHYLEKILFGQQKRIAIPAELYEPQHIPIMIDETKDRIRKTFRCSVCGNIVLYYYGGIKLITNGHFDGDNNMVGGTEIDWMDKLGVPTGIECTGRVLVEHSNGRVGKVRCKTMYYKIGL
jgi:hypothetical protein